MKYNIITAYDGAIKNGLMVADVLNDNNEKVCQVEHTDLMGGFDEINGEVDEKALVTFLKELKVEIENGKEFGYLEVETKGNTTVFTDDTEIFAELKNDKVVYNLELLARAFSVLSVYQ